MSRSEDPDAAPVRGRLEGFRRAYTEAILAADEARAHEVVREAVTAGATAAEIDEHVIAPALWHVGELWRRGDITVAEEHLATEISIRVLTLQREARRVVRGRGEYRVLLGTPAGERHDVALRMVANLLDAAGYETLWLGSDIPAEEFAVCAGRLAPDVVCLSVSDRSRTGELQRAIERIRHHAPQAGYVIGGRGLSSPRSTSPDTRACAHVSDAIDAADAVMKRATFN
jgi:methanogenic corrinoid protein MtbC1